MRQSTYQPRCDLLDLVLLGVLILLSGCGAPKQSPSPATAPAAQLEPTSPTPIAQANPLDPVGTQPVDPQPQPEPPPAAPRWSAQPADPPSLVKATANLSILRFVVPAGAVSRSEEFWKRVDERAVDVAHYELLYKNGLRVGRAPLADFDAYLKLLEKADARSEPAIFAASAAREIPLPMRKALQDAVLYDFDSRDVMTVRSYEDCELFLNLEFAPAPRKPGDVRVSCVPMLRTLRKRIVPVGDIETREFEIKAEEKYFHLNLRTDVPLDRFLIIAPSPEARSSMSIGNAFLTRESATEKLEEVFILVPQPIKLRDKHAEAKPKPAGPDPNQ